MRMPQSRNSFRSLLCPRELPSCARSLLFVQRGFLPTAFFEAEKDGEEARFGPESIQGNFYNICSS